MLKEIEFKDLPSVDKRHPGPWEIRDYGQNGYQAMDGRGLMVGGVRDGYDLVEDLKREEMIAGFNSYVAEVLGDMTDKDQLAREFFCRRKTLAGRRPVFVAEDAKKAASSYQKIGKPHIAEAISGVRYGRKLVQAMKKFQRASGRELDRLEMAFSDFGRAQAQGYFTAQEVGTSAEELQGLYNAYHLHDFKVSLEMIRSGRFADVGNQYSQLICLMNLMGMDLDSLSSEDRELLKEKVYKYQQETRNDCLKSAEVLRDELRNGVLAANWYRVKWYMVAGRLTAAELALTPEEIKRVEGIMV